ncbi:MAG: biotin--[acetyl-CoA-carboxylase] ligase [Proteobacteria bacterium]|nr:biotin--[acetyl-CoA-carboxylase] ligase [Pseudomonadota bacterium]
MKSEILNLLRTRKGILSGEVIREALGISRVAVWKHIKKLVELGYGIEASSNGYRLIASPDALFPWEFPNREDKIHFYPEISSTMDIAWDLGRKGCPEFTVVTADRQTKGRGRMSRTWISEDGGLYFSVILRPEMPATLSFQVNFAASLTLAMMLQKMFGIDAKVKWPNDILVGDAKLSGMLSELETRGDMVSFINLGIGINVNNNPDPKEQKATSLIRLLEKPSSRRDILENFLHDFEARMKTLPDENLIALWKQHTGTLKRHVRITTLKDTHEGFAEDVDETGTLMLRLKDGSLKKVIYGDCFYDATGKQDAKGR